jgi:uncharacterized protein (DUF983 family)
MDIIKYISKRYDWKGYIITCIILSLASFFIHAQDYNPILWESLLKWIPIVWLLVLILMISLTELLIER